MHKIIESPHNAILGLAQKFILSRVLMIFVELKLGELLKKGPSSLTEIAVSLKVHPSALRRFLRLLTAHHIIKEIDEDIFDSAPLTQYFDMILSSNLVEEYKIFDKVIDEFKTNSKSWESIFGAIFREYLEKYLSQLNETSTNPLISFAYEFILAKVVITAAELKLGHMLEKCPLALHEISTRLGMSSHSLKPFLKTLVKHKIIDEIETNIFAATEFSQCLDRVLSPHVFDGYKLFNGALHTLQKNTGSWEHVFGCSFYDYLNSNTEKLTLFKDWCTQSACDWLPPILSECHFPTAKKLVDVGGGGGHFLAYVLEKNPHMTGVLFDQPSITLGTESSPIFKELKHRTEFIGGDFFNSIPKGGDVYTICRTLLIWSDEKSIEIINNFYSAMNSNSKLLIIDFLVPEPKNSKYPRAVINDISLFVIFNSAIRTETEWRKLVSKTLFSISKVFITDDDVKPEPYFSMCIIELIPKIYARGDYMHASPEEAEVERLRLFNESYGPTTKRILAEYVKEGTSVLELGVGTGEIGKWLVNQVGSTGYYIGVDKDPIQINRTKKNIKEAANVQLVEANVYHLNTCETLKKKMPVSGFRVIYCRWLLCHLLDIDRAHVISQITEYLAIGGVFICEEPDYRSMRLLYKGNPQEHEAIREWRSLIPALQPSSIR